MVEDPDPPAVHGAIRHTEINALANHVVDGDSVFGGLTRPSCQCELIHTGRYRSSRVEFPKQPHPPGVRRALKSDYGISLASSQDTFLRLAYCG